MKKPKLIYLADDDQDDRLFLRQALLAADVDAEIVEVENGLDLLTLIQKQAHVAASLILIDMNMPKMNGLETIVALRANANFETVPVVMISTLSTLTLIEKAQQAGANEFITKPTTYEEFSELGVRLTTQFLS